MASNDRDPCNGSVENDESPIMQRLMAIIGKDVEDFVKEREQATEARATSRLASRIDHQESTIKNLKSGSQLIARNNADLKKRLEASEKQNADLRGLLAVSETRIAEADAKAAQAIAEAAKAMVDADDRVARVTADYQARTRRLMECLQPSEQSGSDTASTVAHAGNESGGSATVINSSVSIGRQNNQPEQQPSPSSSDATANARIKREESLLHLSVAGNQPSDGSEMSDDSLTSNDGGDLDLLEWYMWRSESSDVSSMSEDEEIKQQHEAPSNDDGVRHFGGISPDDLLVDEISEIKREGRWELKEEDEAVNGRGEGGAKRQRTE
ncbi:uncharacterized protein FMAN_08559 [Fusarium mangiferae]|uniref:Uncharacterized protein n=1 Tax=Fusarium mangiferae TaxID=192010 RepID=A0A1L7TP51_FUSMA|nr:uncharacterized protein FMAN_08559 [Fusarium mangiferae]CVK98602.1 uncharacterized protein FMAN_08559 [Fusarium mangiferae]